MSKNKVPTLTEVIELTPQEAAPTEPMPLALESIPLESLETPPPVMPRPISQQALIDAVVQHLQPRLDAWIESHASRLLADSLQAHAQALAQALARQISAELPTMARDALDEVRKDTASRSPRQ